MNKNKKTIKRELKIHKIIISFLSLIIIVLSISILLPVNKVVEVDDYNPENYFILKHNESINLTNGGVKLEINGSLDWCHTTGSMDFVLCGDDIEECWEYKKSLYVNKSTSSGFCGVTISPGYRLFCEEYKYGELVGQSDNEQIIRTPDYIKCWFDKIEVN